MQDVVEDSLVEEIRRQLGEATGFDAGKLEAINQQLHAYTEKWRLDFNEYPATSIINRTRTSKGTVVKPKSAKKATFITGVHGIIEENIPKEAPKPKTLEATVYRFTENNPSPLPNDIEPDLIVKRILPIMSTKPNFKSRWRKEIENEPCHIVQSNEIFWWFFLENKQRSLLQPPPVALTQDGHKIDIDAPEETPEKARQRAREAEKIHLEMDKIFGRMAKRHVEFFLRTNTWPDRDDFFQMYPDIMAQTIFALFCECFPDSYEVFQTDFKPKVCDTLSEWFTGARPFSASWPSWNIDEIVSKSIRLAVLQKKTHNEEEIKERERLMKQGDKVEQLSEILDKIDKERNKAQARGGGEVRFGNLANPLLDAEKRKTKESASIETPIPSQIVRFDVNSNSGLMKRYLQDLRGTQISLVRSFFIRRTEQDHSFAPINERATQKASLKMQALLTNSDPPPETFLDVLKTSKKTSREAQTTYKEGYTGLRKEQKRMEIKRTLNSNKIDALSKRILSKLADVRELSDQICELHLNIGNVDDHTTVEAQRMRKFAEIGIGLVEKELKSE